MVKKSNVLYTMDFFHPPNPSRARGKLINARTGAINAGQEIRAEEAAIRQTRLRVINETAQKINRFNSELSIKMGIISDISLDEVELKQYNDFIKKLKDAIDDIKTNHPYTEIPDKENKLSTAEFGEITRVTFKGVQKNLNNIEGYVRNVQKKLKGESRHRKSTLYDNYIAPTRPSTNLPRNRSTRRLRFSSVQEIVSKECDPVLEYIKGLLTYYYAVMCDKSIKKIEHENIGADPDKEISIQYGECKPPTIPVLYKIRANSAPRLEQPIPLRTNSAPRLGPSIPLRNNENKRPASATARRIRRVGGTLRRHKKPKKTRKYKKRRTPRI
jgi:hypothetical protein